MNKGWVKSFTVMEMLINIVIASIIIGMVYFIYASFSKQVFNYRFNVEESSDRQVFLTQLKMDFFEAEKILRNPSSFEVVYYNNKTIKYEVLENALIREQNQNRDTLTINDVAFFTFDDAVSGDRLVEKMVIGSEGPGQSTPMIFMKDYPIKYQQ